MSRKKLIQNRYEVLERIDDGVQSCVHRCIDTHNPKIQIAIKKIPDSDTRDLDSLESIKREFSRLRLLASDMTLSVYDFINQEPIVGFTMDYLPGKSLKDVLDHERELSIEQIVSFLLQLTEAVQQLHEQEYIHSGLDISNVLLDKDGKIVLSEFSFIFEKEEGAEAFPRGKRRKIIPPEYIDDRRLDERSDVYAIGVIGYQLLTGKDPFVGDNLFDRIVQQLEGVSANPGLHREDCPAWLSEAVIKAMQVQAERRFQTAEEFNLLIRKYKKS